MTAASKKAKSKHTGRKRTAPDGKARGEVIAVKTSPSERKRLEAAARMVRVPVSRWVREVALRVADALLGSA